MLPLSESSTYLHYAEQNVLKLQSKSGVEKYSVATNSDAEFVTIYNIKNSSRKVISCHSSLCQYQQGKSRSVKNVENAADLCPHLEIFKAYMLEHDFHEEARTDDVIEEINLNLNSLEASEDEEWLDSEIITHIWACICSLLSRKFMFSFLYSIFITVIISSTVIITVIITAIALRIIQYLNHIKACENARGLSLLHSSR